MFMDPSVLFETYKSLADTLKYYKGYKFDIEPYLSGKVNKIEDAFSLNRNCLNAHECLLLFFPAIEDERKSEEFENIMSHLNSLKEKRGFEEMKINWVNSTCHSDMMERLNFQRENIMKPQLVFLWPWRTAYAVHKGNFAGFAIKEFIEKGQQNRLKFQRIEREIISISNRNCQDPDALLDEEENLNENKENNIESHQEEVIKEKIVENVDLDENDNNKEKKKDDL